MRSYFIFLSRHKLYTLIEALGLIISISFIILIGNYVWQQYRLANSNKYVDRVYVVGSDKYASLSMEDRAELEEKLPSLESSTRLSNQDIALNINDVFVTYPMLEVDKEFFEIFPEFEIIEGNKNDFIPRSILISEKFVEKNFPNENPIGKSLGGDWIVRGIYRITGQTVLDERDVIWIIDDKENSDSEPFSSIGSYLTIIKAPEGTNREELEDNVRKIIKPHYQDSFVKDIQLYDLPTLYFNNLTWQLKCGNKEMLSILLAVVILLLISSIINYINLTLAQTGQRAKEMATRQLHGASTTSIILSKIYESLIFISICSVIAIGVAYILKSPISNMLVSLSMDQNQDVWRYEHLEIVWNVGPLAIFVGFILILGVIAGIIPALYSANYRPIDVVKGTFRLKNRMTFSKIFIIFQNILSVLLISLAIVMECQLNHMKNMPLNADSKNIYLLQTFFEDYSDAVPLIDRVSRIPGVKKIGYGTSYPGQILMYSSIAVEDEEKISAGFLRGDRDYFDIMNLRILSGEKDPKSSGLLYVSESLANSLGITDEESASKYIGKIAMNGTVAMSYGGIFVDVPNSFAGASEFNYNTVFILANDENMNYSSVLIIQTEEESKEMEDKIFAAYEEYVNELRGFYLAPWEHGFISDINNRKFISINSTVALLEIFMGISIILSLLGLIAMSTYYANENTKGIAIRKALGSDIVKEIKRNIRLYMIMVSVAVIMAIPISLFISRIYLSRFAYRIENYWWIFVVASVLSILVAFFSVVWQVSKAAHADPATELKKE